MTDQAAVDKLVARLESATGSDRELGREIYRACGWSQSGIGWYMGPLTYWRSPDGDISFNDDDFRRHDPTASIDAAATIVPEGYGWSVGNDGPEDAPWACVTSPPTEDDGGCEDFEGHADCPAIALCIAALRSGAAHD